MWSGSVGVGKQFGQAGFSLLQHPAAVGHSEQVHPIAIQRMAQQLPMIIHTAWCTGSGEQVRTENAGSESWQKREGHNEPISHRSYYFQSGVNGHALHVLWGCAECDLPAWAELSSIGIALIQLLQHLLALTVREWVAEREVGGGPSHLQQPVSEWEDELVIYNLKCNRREEEETYY